MRSFKNSLILRILLVLALLATITACEISDTDNGDGNQVEGAPELPPVSTFKMDFDALNSAEEAASTLPGSALSAQPAGFTFGDDPYPSGQYATGTTANWTYAHGQVVAWSLLVAAGMVIPVAAFVESFNHTPTQQTDYTWIWTYSVKVLLVTYTAELHGKFIDNGVRWEMYISKQGGYQDFLWYYGESNLPATEGFWKVKDNPNSNKDMIEINWARNLTASTYSIKYTNIVPAGPENGGYIAHAATTGDPYNRTYDIYNKGADRLTNIEWNSTTTEGRVKSEYKFGDEEWHYWNASHEDT